MSEDEGIIILYTIASVKVTKSIMDLAATPLTDIISRLNRAIFGFARVNLLNPIRPIIQGQFNKRPISQGALGQLVNNMELVGVHSDRYSSAIPLLADPDHIDPLCILTDITQVSVAKDLKLTPKGEAEVKSFTAAGGNHRTKALQTVMERLEEKIQRLNQKLEKKVSKSKTKGNKIGEELEMLKAKKAGLGTWTVILYNESGCS